MVGFHQQFINEPSDILDSFAGSEGYKILIIKKVNSDEYANMETCIGYGYQPYQFSTISLKGAHSTMMNGVKTFNKEDSEQNRFISTRENSDDYHFYNEQNNYNFK